MTLEGLRSADIRRFRLWRPLLTFVALSSILLNFGCMKSPAVVENRLVDRNEERYFELNEKLAKQESQLTRLSAAIETLNAQGTPKPIASRTAPPAKAPVGEPVLSDDILDDDKDPLAPLGGETVADSKHETMHLYFTGLQNMEEGKFEIALNSFREFLKSNPEHVYADRAQFQIAEAHFANKEYGLAVVSTNLLEARYPFSFKVPESIYKRALSFAGMGQKDSASEALRNLLKKYPENPVAKLASRKLGEFSAGSTKSSAPPLLEP